MHPVAAQVQRLHNVGFFRKESFPAFAHFFGRQVFFSEFDKITIVPRFRNH